MLDVRTFSTIVKNTPLISIDLCLVYEGKILLCERKNEPLKGRWFTPGGRIYKIETWQSALLRIAQTELGLRNNKIEDFALMGIWDHFYNNTQLYDMHKKKYDFLKPPQRPAFKFEGMRY